MSTATGRAIGSCPFVIPSGSDNLALSPGFIEYLEHLGRATRTPEEPHTLDFTRETFRILDSNERNNAPLTICGEDNRTSHPGICLLYRLSIILLVLVVEDSSSIGDPEADKCVTYEGLNRVNAGMEDEKLRTFVLVRCLAFRPSSFRSLAQFQRPLGM